MASYYYSMLGIVRVRKVRNYIVEVCYKDEDVYTGQYKCEHKWHYVSEYSDVEELNKTILDLCKEETKREIQPDHPDTPDIG
jgi:hypothetical protein